MAALVFDEVLQSPPPSPRDSDAVTRPPPDDETTTAAAAVAALVAIEDDKVHRRYLDAVAALDEEWFENHGRDRSRAPYRKSVDMGRGALFFEGWRAFVSEGGCAAVKNAVAMNIRMNSVSHVDLIGESFKAEYYLDLAYWVPRFARAHYADPATLNTFPRWEPVVNFPEVHPFLM